MTLNDVAHILTGQKIAIPKKRSCNNENVYCKFQDYIHLSIFKLQRRSAPNNTFRIKLTIKCTKRFSD